MLAAHRLVVIYSCIDYERKLLAANSLLTDWQRGYADPLVMIVAKSTKSSAVVDVRNAFAPKVLL